MNRLASLSLLFVVGCAPVAVDPAEIPSAVAASLPPADAQGVLDLVNYPATDAALLDGAVGLDARAAQNIVAHRNGPDGISPSADDVYFTTIAQLDAVPYVGDAAFQKLDAYAKAHPAPAGETVEGVAFLGWQSQSVVWGVNQATQADLNALIDSRAATGLIAKRPFASVAQMGPVAYVGATALEHLRAHAQTWWGAMRGAAPGLGGTFDGVTFDDATAKVALAIANDATISQLTAHGVATSPANVITAERPYGTLAQLANQSGIGTATMKALHNYATSGDWNPGAGGACVQAFDAAVGPHLPDLLFLSESDRPFDLVSFPGAGTSAPTADSVLALLKMPAGYTAQQRSVDDYYTAFEPNSSTSDPNAGADVQAAFAAQLTDVIYVAVFAPSGSINQADVDVYLLGRTSCGDLVGIHAIAVET